MRLGQLVCNLATVAKGAAPGATWDVEDDELLEAARWQIEQLATQREESVNEIPTVSK